MKRAIRRHHYQRLKRLRRKKWEWRLQEKISEGQAASYATTATPCSCWMCGNTRKYWGQVTMKEQIAKLNYIEGCEEANVNCELGRSSTRFSNYY